MATEIWRDIPGFPGYKASDQGHIGSCLKCAGRKGQGKWVIVDRIVRILKPSHDTRGYATVAPSRDGKCHTKPIAKLVMLAFHGPPPKRLEICHENNIRDDNRLCNLRYDTRSANMQESTLAGKHLRKLTSEQAKAIRVEYSRGNITQATLGQRYGVARRTIGDLLCGATYADVITKPRIDSDLSFLLEEE